MTNWISVKDRPMEFPCWAQLTDGRILCSTPNRFFCGDIYNGITHWQPVVIPEPYVEPEKCWLDHHYPKQPQFCHQTTLCRAVAHRLVEEAIKRLEPKANEATTEQYDRGIDAAIAVLKEMIGEAK